MDVVAVRHRYLRVIKKYRAQGHTIVYQDETWCNTNHTKDFVCQTRDDTVGLLKCFKYQGGLNVPSGKGGRLTMPCRNQSWVFAWLLTLFCWKQQIRELYHKEINAKYFEGWWELSLFPSALRKSNKCVIVIENCTYHSRKTEK